MPVWSASRSVLVMIDVQTRLAPAIADGARMIQAIGRLAAAADLLGIPVLATEQNPAGLGATAPALAGRPTILKTSFDATAAAGFWDAAPAARPDVVLVGCEAHVCVLQTAFGLRRAGRRTAMIADAVGSRRPADKAAALARAALDGVEILTAEMLLFEWLEDCGHPNFREILALIR